MNFDITQVDRLLLLQTLFAHAGPLGRGELEYEHRKRAGELVEVMDREECATILADLEGGSGYLDYHKGKPMKLSFEPRTNGRVLVWSDAYDARNGKYRFFEAMLNVFSIDEIRITSKGYRPYIMSDLPQHLVRSKSDELVFRDLIRNLRQEEYELGKYWVIDETRTTYVPQSIQTLMANAPPTGSAL